MILRQPFQAICTNGNFPTAIHFCSDVSFSLTFPSVVQFPLIFSWGGHFAWYSFPKRHLFFLIFFVSCIKLLFFSSYVHKTDYLIVLSTLIVPSDPLPIQEISFILFKCNAKEFQFDFSRETEENWKAVNSRNKKNNGNSNGNPISRR